MRQFGHWFSTWLARESGTPAASPPPDPRHLAACLRPGDVLLVEGTSRFATVIKYLTQSTWSHAALYVGPGPERAGRLRAGQCFVEADILEGVRGVGLEEFAGRHVRICRPVDLAEHDAERLIAYALARIGHHNDLRNVFDLARYLLPIAPVPTRYRRRLLTLGSGDPTRAICSTLVAQAFQSVRYPVLPSIEQVPGIDPACNGCLDDIARERHHTLFAPRDFDVSPYFRIVKPTLEAGFDYRSLRWRDGPTVDSSATSR
jgi:hypothetical protein